MKFRSIKFCMLVQQVLSRKALVHVAKFKKLLLLKSSAVITKFLNSLKQSEEGIEAGTFIVQTVGIHNFSYPIENDFVKLSHQNQNDIIAFGLGAAPTAGEMQAAREESKRRADEVDDQLEFIRACLKALFAARENPGAAPGLDSLSAQLRDEAPETDKKESIVAQLPSNGSDETTEPALGAAPLALDGPSVVLPGSDGQIRHHPLANNSELSVAPPKGKLDASGDLTGCSGTERCKSPAGTEIVGEVVVEPSGEPTKPIDLRAEDLPPLEISACGAAFGCQAALDEPLKFVSSVDVPEAASQDLSSACASTEKPASEPPSLHHGLPVSAAAIEAADAVLQPVGAANEEEDAADLPLQESSAANRLPVEQHEGEVPLKSEPAAEDNKTCAAPQPTMMVEDRHENKIYRF